MLLAKEAATLDLLSGGRLSWGSGRDGWAKSTGELAYRSTPPACGSAASRSTCGGTVALAASECVSETAGVRARRALCSCPSVGVRRVPVPAEVIVLAVRWYLRFGLSYRDVEELLAERGVEVDHVTIYRWVQRFTPLLADAARPCRHAVGDRWFVDETYLKIGGRWRYLYRAMDQFGQVIDVYISPRRDTEAAHRFFDRAIRATMITPVEVVTDKAAAYPRVLDERVPAAWHGTEKYANNRIEADHGQLKRRLRPMRGLKTDAGCPGDHGRTRLRAERPPRPLRARRRGAHESSAGRRIWRKLALVL